MNKTRERIKNVLICVLLLGMVYLTYQVWFFDSPFGEMKFLDFFGNEKESYMIYEGTGSDTESFGIRPVGVFIRDEKGGRGAIYESGASDMLYRALREELAVIMGKTSDAFPASEKEWRSALLANGVLLDYSGNIPMESLRMWFGREDDETGISARYFMFSADGKNVVVYVKDTRSGEISKYTTGYSSQSLMEKTKALTAVKTAYLAVEREEKDFLSVSGETIIMENRAKLPMVSVANAFETFRAETTNACLATFKLRDATSGMYSEQDGTAVYIADMVTLKISPDGVASYNDSREGADETLGIEVECEGETATLAEKVETARGLATALASALPGKGGIYIEDVLEAGEKVEVVFGRTVNGVPVKMKNTSYFMSVQISDGMVKSARANLRYYEPTSQTTDIFTERIAVAAISGRGEKGSLRLLYNDSGESQSISPEWFIGQMTYGEGRDEDGVVES